ncbi:hypothetical protein QYG33_23270 [Xanthomonas euvesicatoria]
MHGSPLNIRRVVSRICGALFRGSLDVGQHIQDNAPTVSEGLARLKEVKDYVRQTVSASFRKLRESGRGLTDANVSQAVREALRDTFEVFEGYME